MKSIIEENHSFHVLTFRKTPETVHEFFFHILIFSKTNRDTHTVSCAATQSAVLQQTQASIARMWLVKSEIWVN